MSELLENINTDTEKPNIVITENKGDDIDAEIEKILKGQQVGKILIKI